MTYPAEQGLLWSILLHWEKRYSLTHPFPIRLLFNTFRFGRRFLSMTIIGSEGVRGVCMVWGGVEVVLIFSLEVTTLQKKKKTKLLSYKLREMPFFSLSIYRGKEKKKGDAHRLG